VADSGPKPLSGSSAFLLSGLPVRRNFNGSSVEGKDETPNGPYIVSGPVTLTDVDGRVIEHPDPMAMCRCGHSSNKPFCDGTHATIDFDGTLAN
jgi:CDGSH-type Zn-finger protein